MHIPHKHHQPVPRIYHGPLGTTFHGVEHPLSTPDVPIHQYLGIKYASVPARFRQSKLFRSYPPIVDASKHGCVGSSLLHILIINFSFRPICPQQKNAKSIEEAFFGLADDLVSKQNLKHDEFECLNLNITCPAGLTPQSRLPVMLWVHG